MAKHVSAFILKTLSLPRELDIISKIGTEAMPLYCGDDFESFRNGANQLVGESERSKLMARLNARVAHLYGLSYEEYQVVLATFPLISEEFKQRCMYEYKELLFDD